MRILCIIAVIGFSMAACDDGGGGGYNPGSNPNPGPGGDNTFTSIAVMEAWLKTQPVRSTQTVKLNVSSLGGDSDTPGSAGYVIAHSGRSVNLDLSGSTITSIGNKAFYDCITLTGVTIPNSVTSIGDSAFWCAGITSVIIPNRVISIGESAFSGWLTSVTIGNSVTSIGRWAFSGSKFTSIIIPASVTSIGDSAFWSCRTLTSVTFQRADTSFTEWAFDCGTSLVTAYKAGGKGTYTLSGETWTKR